MLVHELPENDSMSNVTLTTGPVLMSRSLPDCPGERYRSIRVVTSRTPVEAKSPPAASNPAASGLRQAAVPGRVAGNTRSPTNCETVTNDDETGVLVGMDRRSADDGTQIVTGLSPTLVGRF